MSPLLPSQIHRQLSWAKLPGTGVRRKSALQQATQGPKREILVLCAQVHGLEPNTRYKFRLRLVSPRSHSRLSPPLEVWTAPAPPSSPIIVRDETKAIVLNWRAGPGGATKYVLESRLVNSRDDGTAAQAPTPTVRHLAAPVRAHVRHRTNATAASYDWKVSYEGHETTVRVCGLQPRSTYRFRVRALNDAGHGGPPSALTQASTASEAQMLVPRRAAEQFLSLIHI